MNIEEIREYCLSREFVSESFPFDDTALVFKVYDKMFALLSLPDSRCNLKCDPEKAIELREEYEDIIPGWHMNKKHWNTLDLKGTLSSKLIKGLIDHSFELVVNKLPKIKRSTIQIP